MLTWAYQLYVDGLCPSCGHPREQCRDSDLDGWVEVEEEICYVTAALERHRSEDTTPEPGVMLIPKIDPRSKSGGSVLAQRRAALMKEATDG